MVKLWSKFWKSSIQVRKQRKYNYNAPLHVKHKMIGANLSPELRKEHGIRTLPVRKGDTVTVISGQFKGKTGKVEKVSLSRIAAFVENMTVSRADGSASLYPIHPSNLRIIKLDLSDKRRVEKIERMKKTNGKQ